MPDHKTTPPNTIPPLSRQARRAKGSRRRGPPPGQDPRARQMGRPLNLRPPRVPGKGGGR